MQGEMQMVRTSSVLPGSAGVFDCLAEDQRWVVWRNEDRGGRQAKVPYSPAGGRAKADDPATWGTRAEAEAAARRLVNGHGGGIGIELGELGADTWLAGIDLDTCVDPAGGLDPWAAVILAAVPSYAEASPSGTGIKAFFVVAPEDVRPFLDRLGAERHAWGLKRTIEATGQDHPPAVEVYLSGRYFAVTGARWPGQPDRLAFLDERALTRLAAAIPAAPRQTGSVTNGGVTTGGADTSRSAVAFRRGRELRQAGATYDEMVAALRADPETADWTAQKGEAAGGRELRRIWDRAASQTTADRAQTFEYNCSNAVMDQRFAPLRWTVPDYVPEGLSILAGRQKLGKTWLAMDFAIAVALGGVAMGGVPCQQGDVLYVDLENGLRRIQRRLHTLFPDERNRPDLGRLEWSTVSPQLGPQFIAACETWRQSVPRPAMIVVDVLQRIKPAGSASRNSYENDYSALAELQRWATEHGVSVLILHHTRKGGADDPLEALSGSNGLSACADTTLVLDRQASGITLYVRGRDVEERETALRFDAGRWSVIGDAADVRRSDERSEILSVLIGATEPMGPRDLSIASGMQRNNIDQLLWKMGRTGEVLKAERGRYVHRDRTDLIAPHKPDKIDKIGKKSAPDGGNQGISEPRSPPSREPTDKIADKKPGCPAGAKAQGPSHV
jgi:hypothetical protein